MTVLITSQSSALGTSHSNQSAASIEEDQHYLLKGYGEEVVEVEDEEGRSAEKIALEASGTRMQLALIYSLHLAEA